MLCANAYSSCTSIFLSIIILPLAATYQTICQFLKSIERRTWIRGHCTPGRRSRITRNWEKWGASV
ncbi:hypothetical protein EDD85DRAFT_913267 [Armillaria nabsnona]|nr:hypothetical protein EDD85DRAFT_913267 [Armillaria nabsnona]